MPNGHTHTPDVVTLIHHKVETLRTQAQYLEQLEQELSAFTSNGHAKPLLQHTLRDVVVQVVREAPEQRMQRRAVIAQVRQLLGSHIRPIAIVATLRTRGLFKPLADGWYALKG